MVLSVLSPALHAMNLPILTCSYCMRKVGLWNFHQMDGTVGDGDSIAVVQSAPTTAPASAPTHEGQADRSSSASPTPATTPSRMKLRSQDSTRSEASLIGTQQGIPRRVHREWDGLMKLLTHVWKLLVFWCMLQGEGTSSPVGLRSRSRDSPSPSEEVPSPLTRGKRSATRGRGLGDAFAPDGAASPPQPPKRLCLSSVGGAVRTNFN